jgi:hypothetical protein
MNSHMMITRREAMAQGRRCQWGFAEVRPKSFDICGELVCGEHTELGGCYCAKHRAGMSTKRPAGGHFSLPRLR